jgi:hypothetical protein
VPRVAEHADKDHNGDELIELIAGISKHQPSEAYEIWSTALTPARFAYPPEAIEQALTNLVKSGPMGKLHAKQFASTYLLRSDEEIMHVPQKATEETVDMK